MKPARQAGMVLITLAAMLGCGRVIDQTTTKLVTTTATAATTATTSRTMSCGSQVDGECSYLLYSSDCNEGNPKNGHRVLVCTHEVISEFSLKPGESRSFTNLAGNVKQCSSLPKEKPKFPDCMQ
jgi:hypothetical protein